MISEPEFDINELYQAAHSRWLKAPEVLFILTNHEKCRFNETVPQIPPSGTLLLFNKRVVKFFRNDGHNWKKKRSTNTTAEGHEKLKVRKVEALSCYYAQGVENQKFRRRSYWMLDPEYEHIVLVHYREVIEGRRRCNAGSTPCLAGGISSMLNTGHFTQNQCSTSAISESYGTYHNTLDPGSMEVSSQVLDPNNGMSHFEQWATFSELDNLSESKGRYNSQPTLCLTGGISSISSPRYFSAPNQCSTSAINQSYGTYHKSLDPGFMEVSSQVFNKNSELGQLEGRDIVGEFCNSTEAEINEALQRLGDELSFGDKVEISPQCRPNEKSTDYGFVDYERRPNQDELVAGLEYGKVDHFSCGNASTLDDSNKIQLLLNTDEYAFERKESPLWKELQVEDYPVSTLIGFQSNNFNTLEGNVADPINENLQSSSGRGENSGDLTKQQEKWTSPWLDNSGSNTGNWDNYSPMFENDSATQFLSNSDNTMASLNSASSLQQVANSTSLANFSGANTQETNPNYYTMWYDQENQLENRIGADSRLTVAHEQRFSIQEISPEWAYAEDHTKIIITGSFNCDPSNREWACMFGDVEVPIQIIQEGVLCCQAPSHIPGKVTLCITTGNRESCSEVREFEYRAAPRSSDHSSLQPTDATKSTEELQLLLQFVQMLMCDTFVQKGYSANSGTCVLGKSNIDADTCAHMIKALLVGSESQSSIMDWLLQELLKDKLRHWLLSKCEKGETADCNFSKKDQEIIHMVAGLGFEWALNPILSCGIGINFRDTNGWTALHHAAHFGREKMVSALIAAGAFAGAVTDPTPHNPAGKTVGSIAAARGHKGLAGYLSEWELTSHLSSLTLEESEFFKGPAAEEAEKTVESISNGSLGCTKDQIALKDSLHAVRTAKLAAACIQAAFRAHSFKKRQQREALANVCDEYGITVNDIPGLSAMSKLMFHDLDNCKLEKAALSIQKNYRGCKERQKYTAVRQKVIKIQAHVRRYQAREKYKVILWAVGVLDKILLRWRRKGAGLRGFRTEMESADASDDEDIVKVFRKEKVHARIEQAVSWVISMVQAPDSRKQYWRLLESYRRAKAEAAELSSKASEETASSSQSSGENMEISMDDIFQYLSK